MYVFLRLAPVRLGDERDLGLAWEWVSRDASVVEAGSSSQSSTCYAARGLLVSDANGMVVDEAASNRWDWAGSAWVFG